MGTARGSEWRTGQGRRDRGDKKNLGNVGRTCTTIPGGLRVGRCRLDLARTSFVTAER